MSLTARDGEGRGSLSDPHTILTASHMLWEQDLGMGASQVSVYPNYQPGNAPIAGQEAWHFNMVDDSGGMMSQASSASDFAIIDMATDLSSFGSFGTLANYTGGTVHITGYPASAGVTQTDSVGTVYADTNFNVLDYGTISASPGNSGGPIWENVGSAGNSQPEVVGVVSTTGWAAQLTSADLQQIQAWQQQDSFLWNTTLPQTTTVYDAQGHVASVTTHAVDGTTNHTDYNTAHVNPWLAATSTYDGQGALTFTTIYQTNSTFVTTYDPPDIRGWRDAVSGYDATGKITYVTVEKLNGTSEYTVYDHPGIQAAYTVYDYDAAHHLVSQSHYANGVLIA
jgi:hypothetical protein